METHSLPKIHNQLIALQNALDVSGVGYWQIDSEDRIECDAHSKALLGIHPTDSLRDLTEFLMQIEESQHGSFLDALDRARTSNQPVELNLLLEKPLKGRNAGFKLSARACQLPGEPNTYLCGLLQPLPESAVEVEKRFQSALAEARGANVELANFASIASHDMREPLRMITSYLRLLQERSPAALDDRARRYIKYACDGADRMRTLIEDLLSYARLEKSDKDFEPLALDDIMANAIDNLRTNIRDTHAEVTVAIDHAPIVIGDSVRLTRLFQNLIANAIKFNRPQKTPQVRITFNDGEHVQAPQKWIISIEDQGIGIHPDHHEMLFNLFRRLNTHDEFDGSGIGLAVCKKIAQQHGGLIWFESNYGHGSTFYVALNKADAQSLA
ncbi:ATP-binding protein [Coraliomargarita sp. SDUM461003]|uniref:histidine kinase n=1 Tax=Thalassobacterium maritimum TaxID=3041265 RepID=A0ABU1AS41_9BACT|nr:ATP-binding protein [Coraliomargarita sp. SDUM461003]MDQ8206981.1 ATP-binding protein [Coraliomargarita sp. SDUM461003]